VTFDTWYTQPAFCRDLDQTLHLPYVGRLKGEAEILGPTGSERLDAFAQRLLVQHKEARVAFSFSFQGAKVE